MLITRDQLIEDLFDSFEVNLHEHADIVDRVIEDVSAAIETHLDRVLMLARHITFPEWNQVARGRYEFVVRQWPIVQVLTEGVSVDGPRTLITSNPGITEVEYYAGFREDGQELEGLQESLKDLTVLPPKVDGDIRRCTLALCTYELSRALNQTYGRQSHTMTTGDTTASITVDRADVYRDELRRLEAKMNL